MSEHPGTSTSGVPVALFVWVESHMGGVERRFLRVLSHVQERGHDVHLFTSAQGVQALESLGLSCDANKLHVLPSATAGAGRSGYYLALMRRAFRIAALLRGHGIRHLHFGGNPGADSMLYGLLSRFACPFSVSVVNSTRAYRKTFRNRLFMRQSVRRCARIDCLSEGIRADLKDFLGSGVQAKCLVSPCSFTDLSAARAAATKDVDIALVSRMVPFKGHALLAEALQELTARGSAGLDVHVRGSGPSAAEIQQQFDALSGHRCTLGQVNDPFALLARSKIFVSLQERENYPSQSLLEAMASECAIVATDVGSTRQLLDERCAILIERNSSALADALETLLADARLREALGRTAASVVAGSQTIGRFADYFLQDILRVPLEIP